MGADISVAACGRVNHHTSGRRGSGHIERSEEDKNAPSASGSFRPQRKAASPGLPASVVSRVSSDPARACAQQALPEAWKQMGGTLSEPMSEFQSQEETSCGQTLERCRTFRATRSVVSLAEGTRSVRQACASRTEPGSRAACLRQRLVWTWQQNSKNVVRHSVTRRAHGSGAGREPPSRGDHVPSQKRCGTTGGTRSCGSAEGAITRRLHSTNPTRGRRLTTPGAERNIRPIAL